MNRQASLYRKIAYIAAVALLLLPLSWLSQPTVEDNGAVVEGQLAKLRREHDLSPARLGEIDPASSAMNLATFGMRGVAANLLWHKALDYKKKEEWHALSATLNQIIKLQPNFTEVWVSQGHNLSYNISREFDNFEHRYAWVKKGISFLLDGTRYNRKELKLHTESARFLGQKLGIADERVQFRRLYRVDRDFHDELRAHVDDFDRARGPLGFDNWLTSSLFYAKAEDLVKTRGLEIRGDSPLLFYSKGPITLCNYAEALERDLPPDEQAQRAWQDAQAALTRYAGRQIPHTAGHLLTLGGLADAQREADAWRAKLEALLPGVADRALAAKRAKLTPAEIEALETPLGERTVEQYNVALGLTAQLDPAPEDFVAEAPTPQREKALRLAAEWEQARAILRHIQNYRHTSNFDYWQARAAAESTDGAIRARRAMFEADKLVKEGRFTVAPSEAGGAPSGPRALYDSAFAEWARLFDQYPQLLGQSPVDGLDESLKNYRFLFEQRDETVPEDFPLYYYVEAQERQLPVDLALARFKARQAKKAAAPTTEGQQPTDTKPAGDVKPAGDAKTPLDAAVSEDRDEPPAPADPPAPTGSPAVTEPAAPAEVSEQPLAP